MPSCHPHLVFSRLNLQLHPVAGEPDLALALGDLRPQHVHHLHQATINQLMRIPVAKFYVSSTKKNRIPDFFLSLLYGSEGLVYKFSSYPGASVPFPPSPNKTKQKAYAIRMSLH